MNHFDLWLSDFTDSEMQLAAAAKVARAVIYTEVLFKLVGSSFGCLPLCSYSYYDHAMYTSHPHINYF